MNGNIRVYDESEVLLLLAKALIKQASLLRRDPKAINETIDLYLKRIVERVEFATENET